MTIREENGVLIDENNNRAAIAWFGSKEAAEEAKGEELEGEDA